LLFALKNRNEFESGKLIANDGDVIRWKTERTAVEF